MRTARAARAEPPVSGRAARQGAAADQRPLHRDVRLLADALGRVVRRIEGHDCFEAVEKLRQSCRARRVGAASAPSMAEIIQDLELLPLPVAARVARAFTLFFLLINSAEQVQRVRSRRARRRKQIRGAAQVGSIAWAFGRLRASGYDADRATKLFNTSEVRPVLTAHPTEATRRTILDLQSRIADALLARDRATRKERSDIERRIEAEIELLWLTAEVRAGCPSVLDEVSNALWYLQDRLLPAAASLSAEARDAFRATFGVSRRLRSPITFGSWVGGDRDGNPQVTPEVTMIAVRRAAETMAAYYRRRVEALARVLAVSVRVAAPSDALLRSLLADRQLAPDAWRQNHARNDDEPIRLKLTLIAARLAALERRLGREAMGEAPQPADPESSDAAYVDPAELEADLTVVAEALEVAGAAQARSMFVDPLREEVAQHGFHGFRSDVREDSSVHAAVLDELAAKHGLAAFGPGELRQAILTGLPLGDARALSDSARRTVGTFEAIRCLQQEVGEAAVSTYVVTMTHAADDLLRVLAYAKTAGLVDLSAARPTSRLDIVPLFETHADLVNADRIMADLLNDGLWRRQLRARGDRQEVMLGYSDSAKDVGLIASAWALYRAQVRLATLFMRERIDLSFFHGRGGTVGRGGGSPVYRALAALPPGTIGRALKVTEQGEVVSQKYGLLPIAERSLEVLAAGTLLASVDDWRRRDARGDEDRFGEAMDRMAETGRTVFRRLVHDDERLFSAFLRVTPVKELAYVHFGSRPVYRGGGAGTLAGLRAIPWVFGWTQIRLMLPAWLGVGSALEEMVRSPADLDLLRRMARDWPFFDDLLANVEMVCAKADLEIAAAYFRALGGDRALFRELEREFRRTTNAILLIRQSDTLLAGQPALHEAIGLRNRYLDPLSFLQMHFLRQRKAASTAAEQAHLAAALGTTLNGIAQGLRNTG